MGYAKVPVGGRYKVRRYYRRKLTKLGNSIKNTVFPIPPISLLWLATFLITTHLAGLQLLKTPVEFIEGGLEPVVSSPLIRTVFALALVSFCLWYVCVQLARWAFTLTLYYRGWLFETVGKPASLPTKLFMGVIKLFNRSARFFSFQDLLPWQPLPRISSTISRFLRSVRPILNDVEYAEMEQLSEEFANTIAPSLQRKLLFKWLTSRNYVSDWWKEVVYMRYRDSLIHTNVGCADTVYQVTTSNQAARAANVTLIRQMFCRDIYKKQSMRPITVGGIPLCASQYEDYDRSLRIPHETSDKMVRLGDARHIAVYCKGCWYKVNIYHGRRILRPAELERTFQAIIDKTPESQPGEKYLSALTAGKRDLWAKVRKEHFATGENRRSLSIIEDSLDVIFLDDEERHFDESDPTLLDYEYARCLHGNGYQLWCDKPTVFIFSKNGRFTCNGEHSVADALVYVHVREYIKYHEEFTHTYAPDGHAKGDVEIVPTPEKLNWELNEQVQSAIDESYQYAKSVADNFENSSCMFHDFGKDFMKKIGLSPDAFIQNALQMAYYKDQGGFGLTYEPAMMRLYRDGRTETVRSCSVESSAFVKGMHDANVDAKTRLSLLREACDFHQTYYRVAMSGHGCDRHLFALYVLTKYLNIKSPFLDKVFSMPFSMSTSQTPQHQISEHMSLMNKKRDLFWPAGGFTCPEGSNYGVCYTIAPTGDMLSFHVTSWKSIETTDAKRFKHQIASCLNEMRQMCIDGSKKSESNGAVH